MEGRSTRFLFRGARTRFGIGAWVQHGVRRGQGRASQPGDRGLFCNCLTLCVMPGGGLDQAHHLYPVPAAAWTVIHDQSRVGCGSLPARPLTETLPVWRTAQATNGV